MHWITADDSMRPWTARTSPSPRRRLRSRSFQGKERPFVRALTLRLGPARRTPLEMWRDWSRGHRAFEALARLRVPLIVVLTGHAFGGGPGTRAPGHIRSRPQGNQAGTARVRPRARRRVGLARRRKGAPFCSSSSRRMALTGVTFSAEERRRLALSMRSSPNAREWCAQAHLRPISPGGPLAVQMVKATINAAEGEDQDAPIEGPAGALAAYTQDLAEALRFSRQAPRRASLADSSDSDVDPPALIAVDPNKLNALLGRFSRDRAP